MHVFFGNADEERSRNTSTSTTLPKHDRIDELGSAINAREKNNAPFLFLNRNAVSIKKNIILVSIISIYYQEIFRRTSGQKTDPPRSKSQTFLLRTAQKKTAFENACNLEQNRWTIDEPVYSCLRGAAHSREIFTELCTSLQSC